MIAMSGLPFVELHVEVQDHAVPCDRHRLERSPAATSQLFLEIGDGGFPTGRHVRMPLDVIRRDVPFGRSAGLRFARQS